MRYYALATDYDGTLATHGAVDPETVAALGRLRETGRRLILVTGRELPELQSIFPELDLFDRVVAENGALLYRPREKEEKLLAEPPPPAFAEALRAKGVRPLSVGRVIVATFVPNEGAVLEAIRESGLELQVIFNKDAVMVLPTGVNKALGLAAALEELGLSPRNAVGVGDAENDHAFLDLCESAVAVGNALPALKERADWVTAGTHGAGVRELVDALLADDLAGHAPARRRLPLGTGADGRDVEVEPFGTGILLAGSSGGGKTTFTGGFLETLAARGYQACVFDPEGDYRELEGAVALGDARRPPAVEEVMKVLEDPARACVICALAVPFGDRPAFFQKLFPGILELRARTGRPHWMVLDEAHHLLPAAWAASHIHLPQDLRGIFLVTLEPDHLQRELLAAIDLILATGSGPAETLAKFGRALGEAAPEVPASALARGEALAWSRRPALPPFWLRAIQPKADLRRHVRKYAEGELLPDEHFHFRGPEGKLDLRAQNLGVFLQMADGVDDATWLHHLVRGDYSEWFRRVIKDPGLAQEAEAIEARKGLGPRESRVAIRKAVERRYTGPA